MADISGTELGINFEPPRDSGGGPPAPDRPQRNNELMAEASNIGLFSLADLRLEGTYKDDIRRLLRAGGLSNFQKATAIVTSDAVNINADEEFEGSVRLWDENDPLLAVHAEARFQGLIDQHYKEGLARIRREILSATRRGNMPATPEYQPGEWNLHEFESRILEEERLAAQADSQRQTQNPPARPSDQDIQDQANRARDDLQRQRDALELQRQNLELQRMQTMASGERPVDENGHPVSVEEQPTYNDRYTRRLRLNIDRGPDAYRQADYAVRSYLDEEMHKMLPANISNAQNVQSRVGMITEAIEQEGIDHVLTGEQVHNLEKYAGRRFWAFIARKLLEAKKIEEFFSVMETHLCAAPNVEALENESVEFFETLNKLYLERNGLDAYAVNLLEANDGARFRVFFKGQKREDRELIISTLARVQLPRTDQEKERLEDRLKHGAVGEDFESYYRPLLSEADFESGHYEGYSEKEKAERIQQAEWAFEEAITLMTIFGQRARLNGPRMWYKDGVFLDAAHKADRREDQGGVSKSLDWAIKQAFLQKHPGLKYLPPLYARTIVTDTESLWRLLAQSGDLVDDPYLTNIRRYLDPDKTAGPDGRGLQKDPATQRFELLRRSFFDTVREVTNQYLDEEPDYGPPSDIDPLKEIFNGPAYYQDDFKKSGNYFRGLAPMAHIDAVDALREWGCESWRDVMRMINRRNGQEFKAYGGIFQPVEGATWVNRLKGSYEQYQRMFKRTEKYGAGFFLGPVPANAKEIHGINAQHQNWKRRLFGQSAVGFLKPDHLRYNEDWTAYKDKITPYFAPFMKLADGFLHIGDETKALNPRLYEFNRLFLYFRDWLTSERWHKERTTILGAGYEQISSDMISVLDTIAKDNGAFDLKEGEPKAMAPIRRAA